MQAHRCKISFSHRSYKRRGGGNGSLQYSRLDCRYHDQTFEAETFCKMREKLGICEMYV